MKNRKPYLCYFFLAFVFLTLPLLLSGGTGKIANNRFPLTVRVYDGKQPVTGLKAGDFRLTVNGVPTAQLKSIEKNTAMSDRPEFLGRNFVLSFNITMYSEPLQEMVTYFVSDILSPNDTLFLVTPLKVYRIDVSSNKNGMIFQISKLLTGDCAEYKKQLDQSKRALENQVRDLTRYLRRGRSDDQMMIASYKRISMFFNTFPSRFSNYCLTFLYPRLDRYRQILDGLSKRDGERWWFHVEQGDLLELFSGIKDLTGVIDAYNTTNDLARQAFTKPLANLKRMLEIAGSFPEEAMTKLFLHYNTRYSMLTWNQRLHKNTMKTGETVSQLVTVLNRIAGKSGGIALQSASPAQGAQQLAKHRDYYYQLQFIPGNTKEKKVLDLKLLPKQNQPGREDFIMAYRTELNRSALEKELEHLQRGKVTIRGLKYKKAKHKGKPGLTLSFVLESFEMNDKDKNNRFGLVKVRIDVLDSRDNRIFRTGNTLRTSKKKVAVSIPLPLPRNKERIRLVITACDMIANRLTSVEETVTSN